MVSSVLSYSQRDITCIMFQLLSSLYRSNCYPQVSTLSSMVRKTIHFHVFISRLGYAMKPEGLYEKHVLTPGFYHISIQISNFNQADYLEFLSTQFILEINIYQISYIQLRSEILEFIVQHFKNK